MQSTQTVPHVIAFPQTSPVEKITQLELDMLLNLRLRASQLETQIESAEKSIIDRLRGGTIVEDGNHVAEVKRTARRSPAWKQITRRLAKRLGLDPDQYCSNVIAHTKPSESFSLIVA